MAFNTQIKLFVITYWRNEKNYKQCLLDTPRTRRVYEKNLVLASDSSNQQTLVLKKKISVESVKTRFQ